MNLEDVIPVIKPVRVIGSCNANVTTVACHPGEAHGKEVVFVCMDEYLEYNQWQTWQTHLGVLDSIKPVAVVVPESVLGFRGTQIIVKNPRRAYGQLSRAINGFPDRELRIFGVTGTNGKTTTTRLLGHLLSALGMPCGTIGTLGIELQDGLVLPGTYTTPLAGALYAALAEMANQGAKAVAMEVSSHGLALDRVEGLRFDGGILTNIERDHLDFHGSVEAYANAKQKLFEMIKNDGICILNGLSPYCNAIREHSGGTVYTYGKAGSGCDFELVKASYLPTGSRFHIREKREKGHVYQLQTALAGPFQVENTLAAYALARALGFHSGEIAQALPNFPPVCGRMEQIQMPNGCTAIVDYAHNPDGLKNLLEASRGLCKGKLHLVFGCGGDRDKGKRPIMGELASSLADVVWVTSDNPRNEDPCAIITDILAGIYPDRLELHTESNRKTAIESAYAQSSPIDLLIVAGKGHEDYQLVGDQKFYFSDQAVLRAIRCPSQ